MKVYSNIDATLGHAALPCSRIGLGTWAIGGGWGPQPEEQSLEAILTALKMGCHFIDTAPLYGNGRAERLVARAFELYGSRVTTVTKIHPLGYHWAPEPGTPITDVFPPEHIREQAEASRQRLQTDCLDCLLFQTWCPTWSQERQWYETMLELQERGIIRTFGISVSDHRHDEANEIIKAGLVDIIETPYSILDQRAAESLFPIAQQYQVSIIARSPLASGALAEDWRNSRRFHRTDWRRRIFRYEHLERTIERVEKLKNIVRSDIPLAQIALRFCLSHPAVTVAIPGAQNAEHVACNFAALEQGPLPMEMLEQIASLWHEEFRYHVQTSVGAEINS